MAHLERKTFSDAGVVNTIDLFEKNDQGGIINTTPKSARSIRGTANLLFSNKIVEGFDKKLTIADGDVRPGTTR